MQLWPRAPASCEVLRPRATAAVLLAKKGGAKKKIKVGDGQSDKIISQDKNNEKIEKQVKVGDGQSDKGISQDKILFRTTETIPLDVKEKKERKTKARCFLKSHKI